MLSQRRWPNIKPALAQLFRLPVVCEPGECLKKPRTHRYYEKRADFCQVNKYTCIAVQSQKAVSAYLTGKQILPFGFAEQLTPGMMESLTNHK